MIISASRKTDLPAFYAEWFMNRLRAGYCMMRNSYNGREYRVELGPGHVAGFVFWTKDIRLLLPHLDEVQKRAPFMVQYTINNYPVEIEPNVPATFMSVIESARQIAERYGEDVLVWRYDPIFLSTLTPAEWHIHNFGKLAQNLSTSTNEVVISFAQGYRKTVKNVRLAMDKHSFQVLDPVEREDKRKLLHELLKIARSHGLKLSVCSQPEVHIEGVEQAHCADAKRLSKIAGTQIEKAFQATRKHCGCFESRDIGEYNTCRHDCIYCYATENPSQAEERFRKHDPTSEFLFE